MDHNELLFAAEVRSQAVELRKSDWLQYSRTPDKIVEYEKHDDARRQDQTQWFADHPLEPYVLRVVSLIRDTAAYIRTLPAD